ncbi:RagB/SusD family nutrient uptake outer membrane protein [uncultured Bacteroides sp.]|uniref:RagB/SusD family nutrient uptake outer membrane protein n=1 Tax=uncultured Bacteroides sp. TaxID=162156 RepID=UPI0026316993|nr:RagB/SusD family nutrient uptake outer membrane protein [uncultured Bacteroides sp.]
MKKIYKLLLYGIIVSITSSCTDFLNISPDANLKEEEVFTDMNNIRAYFNPVYSKMRNGNPLYLSKWGSKWSFEELTDAAENGAGYARSVINGNWKEGVSILISERRPIFKESFVSIRICNNVIANIDRVENAISEEEIYDLLAQAYFFRGYAYFQLCRMWGGMPYMYEPLASDDDFDMPRLSAVDTYKAIAADMDLAYENFVKANKVRRDPKPGETGNLSTTYKLNQPNGCAALALKSRALLYAASPLNNNNNDQQLWIDAAKASLEAIRVAEDNGYILLPIEQWLDNTYNKKYTNEQIWADSHGKLNFKSEGMTTLLTGPMMNNTGYATGILPTQNFVDRYEIAPVNGQLAFPMNTEEERNKAIEAGVYNPQTPYKGLDKRFYHTIFYNMAPTVYKKKHQSASIQNKINMWYQIKTDGTKLESDCIISDKFKGYAFTGYMQKRLTGDINWTNTGSKEITDPLFMLSELYLNYAEAANEIGGPEGSVEGGMTSYQALMVIRDRAEQGDVRPEYLINKDVFRERIKNERSIELAFIGHYFYDCNRWMDSSKQRGVTLYGMDVEKLSGNYDITAYPEGYRYTRLPLIDTKQMTIWHDAMYRFPFTLNMYYQFKDFDTSLNPYW